MNNELMVKINDDVELVKKFQEVAKQLKGLPNLKKYNDGEILMLLFKGRDLQMSPLEAIEQLFIVQGRPCMSAQSMNSRIRQCGHSIKVKQWNEKECSLTGKRKDTGDELTSTFTIEDAKRANLVNRQNWQNHPKSMLYARAMSQLARSLFPDCLYGIYTRDEIEAIDSDDDALEVDALILNYEVDFLEKLLANQEDKKQKLLENFGISSFEEIKRSQWPSVMEAANRMIDKLNGKK